MRKFLIMLTLFVPLAAFAQQPAAHEFDMLNLTAAATEEAVYDQATATFAYDEQGKDSPALADKASQTITIALKQAKTVKEVRAHTGQFSTYPVYDKDQKPVGWRVHAELLIESTDFKALAALVNTLASTLPLSNMRYSLTPATRNDLSRKLESQAIAAFREKALRLTQGFGYTTFQIGDVTVGENDAVFQRSNVYAAPAQSFAKSALNVPMEAGTTTVTVTVNGSVKMKK
jgi:predicted secreted protein